MSREKKKIRQKFREEVFKRDKNKCRLCGISKIKLDAHHITDADQMPGGGYVKENGITLCDDGEKGCHFKAELHTIGKTVEGYEPETLYEMINSSYDIAYNSSLKLL